MKKFDRAEKADSSEARIKNTLDAFKNSPAERNLSAMEVVVSYVARVGRMVHPKPAEMYVSRLTREYTTAEGYSGEQWDDRLLNAYALRDEFLGIKSWNEALDFLCSTGIFSPLNDAVTWREFQQWQRLAHLVQEHDGLATTMRSNEWAGENGEVLKALSGICPTSFFGSPMTPEPESGRKWRADSEVVRMVREGQAVQEQKLRELCSWFRNPPVSVQWVPKKPQDNLEVLGKLQRGGAMLEFLLPQNDLQPVLLIEPRATLQAIAAAIYGDRVNGVEYRTCEMCGSLFKLGAHREKKYCDRERCKNRAHQKHRRSRPRNEPDKSLKGKVKEGQAK